MKLKNIFPCVGLAVCLLFSGCKGGGEPGNIGDEMTFKDGDKIAEITIEGYGTMKAKLFPDIAPNGVDNFIKLAEQGYYNGLKIHRVMKDACIQGGSLNGDGTGGEAVVGTNGTFPIETSVNARNFYGALGYANTNGENTTQFYIVNCKKQTDLAKISSDKVLEWASSCSSGKESLEDTDPSYTQFNAQETYYKNLAEMVSKATEKVTEKYATTGGYPLWDGGYTVFGQVFEGLDVLDAISETNVTMNNSGELSRPTADIIIESVKITEYKTPEPEPEETTSTKKKRT